MSALCVGGIRIFILCQVPAGSMLITKGAKVGKEDESFVQILLILTLSNASTHT